MSTKTRYLGLLLITVLCCDGYSDLSERKLWLKEIKAVENEFNMMARDSGLAIAFGHFAHENAVLQREGRFIKGRDSIFAYYNRNASQDMELSWEPSFIDVSDDGSLGYTYGNYKFTVKDSTGSEKVSTGVFHTVWKRREDGSWRYVWD